MNLSKPHRIQVRGAENGPGARIYRQCQISNLSLTHLGAAIDPAHILYLWSTQITLTTSSSFSRDDTKGNIAFSTPGIATEMTHDLFEIEEIHEEEPQRSTGCASIVLIAISILGSFVWLYRQTS